MYAVCNLLWNGALLLLTQRGSALLTFLALKLQVPLVALLSALPWPLLRAHGNIRANNILEDAQTKNLLL